MEREIYEESLPRINLNHVEVLTDGVGIIQHANGSSPNYDEGYSIDDVARAAVLISSLSPIPHGEISITKNPREFLETYLSFMEKSFNDCNGRFRNFMSYDGRWLEFAGSEDSHARTLWSLGYLAHRDPDSGIRDASRELFKKSLPALKEFNPDHIRSAAFSMVGINEYMEAEENLALENLKTLSKRMVDSYARNSSKDWRWFDDTLTYANAKLSHALIVAGERTHDYEMIDIGLDSLLWLTKVQSDEVRGHFVPIGCYGFYERGKERARFDQQPIEAHATVSACLAAYDVTDGESWFRESLKAFNWFMGANDLRVPMYDEKKGECYDGLRKDGVNTNKGAESTLAPLLSLLELKAIGLT